MLYEIHNKHILDPKKKNMIVFLLENTLDKKPYVVTYQYVFNTLSILSENFNIIIVPKNRGISYLKHYVNHPQFSRYAYIEFDKGGLYNNSTAKTMPLDKKISYINETFAQLEQNDSWLFEKLAGTLSSHFIIPGLKPDYEILSDNPKEIQRRDKAIERFETGLINNKLISHNAFIHHAIGFPVEFMAWIMKNYPNVWHYGFCHDTGSAWLQWVPEHNPFTKNIKCYYFVDDNRGSRAFNQYPLNALQDFYGKQLPNKNYYDSILTKKPYDLVWGGTFPFEVDYRIESYYKYFHQLNAKACLYTNSNGKAVVNRTNILSKKYATDTTILKFVADITNNKYVQSTLPYEEYNVALTKALFTLVLKCYYGKYDSLCFRPINSLFFGTIPLIADDYDVNYLQMPKHFRDLLVVSNHYDIEQKVKYYRNNQNEYRKLFYELFDYYIDPKYFDTKYYQNEFKTEYFSEIY